MSNNEEFNIEEIDIEEIKKLEEEIEKFREEIRPSVIEQVKNDPSIKNASDDEIYAKYEEIMNEHEQRYAQEHPLAEEDKTRIRQNIMRYFEHTRQRIQVIEEKALRTLATRRLQKNASEEEINAKMEEVNKEQKKMHPLEILEQFKISKTQEKKEILLLIKKGEKNG